MKEKDETLFRSGDIYQEGKVQLIEQVGVRWLLRVSPKKQDSMYKDQVLGRIFGLSRERKMIRDTETLERKCHRRIWNGKQ